MKRILAFVLVLISTFAVAGISSAQQHRVKVTVPFSFTVGDYTLPPGRYAIDSDAILNDVLALTNWDKNTTALATGRANQSNVQSLNALIFHRYGNLYFLSQIRSEGASINVDFPVTKAENRARARLTVAGRLADDHVLIALNQ